jgi:hypothetical protein
MTSRLLLSASVVALLSIAPAIAQESSGSSSGSGGTTVIPQTQSGDQSGTSGSAGASGSTTMETQSGTGGTSSDTTTTTQSGSGSGSGSDTTTTTQSGSGSDATTTTGQSGSGDTTTTTGQSGQSGDQNNQNAQSGQETDQTQTGSTDTKVEITEEKKTVIREKLITNNVTKIDRSEIDFDISIGVAVPSTIALQPLPATVIEVVPAYRDYLYFVLADGTIVIVEPGTMRIAYVIAA